MRRTILFALGGVLGGAIIHIVVVFLLPGFAVRDAWTAMGAYGADGEFHLLPAIAPAAAGPFLDPSFAYAVCRFRLADGPVRVMADPPDDFWSVAVFDRRGRALYSLNDRTAARPALDLFLVTPEDLAQLRRDPPEFLETAIVVDLPIESGFILLRAFVADPTLRAGADAALAAADCDAPLEDAPLERAANPGAAPPDGDDAGDAVSGDVPGVVVIEP